MSDRKPQTLRRKLFLARRAAESVPKRGHNNDGDYDFARFEDVMAEASKQLEKRDILIIPQLVDEQLYFGRKGITAKAVIEYEVIDTVGLEESMKLRWSGTGQDAPGDKAIFKATTGTEKYFLAKLLGMTFGTDPEEDVAPPNEAASPTEADKVRARQDAAAEAPDVPPALHPVPDPESIEGEMPADAEGLG